MTHYETLIKGGTVIDGTGVPRFKADVAVNGDTVAKIDGVRPDDTADRVIDATGCHVVPGYIDIHTHYDAQILWDPYCTISGWHGVTSVVLGNCGFGFAPIPPELRERAQLSMTRNEAIPIETMIEGMEWDKHGWVTFPDWLEHIKSIPKGVNAMQLFPLNPAYAWAMGGWEEAKERRPTQAELDHMAEMMHEAMDLGAVGFSYQRCGPVSTQPDFDGSPMITDLLTDEEILYFGAELAKRGEGFIEMFDKFPTTYETLEDFMDALGEVSGRPIVRNILMGDVKFPERHRKFLAWLDEGPQEGPAALRHGLHSTRADVHHVRGLEPVGWGANVEQGDERSVRGPGRVDAGRGRARKARARDRHPSGPWPWRVRLSRGVDRPRHRRRRSFRGTARPPRRRPGRGVGLSGHRRAPRPVDRERVPLRVQG